MEAAASPLSAEILGAGSKARRVLKAGPGFRRRAHVLAYTAVTTAIVLLLALAEWATEKLVSDRSRAASTTIEICIVLVGTLVFRPVHQRIEVAIDAAFHRRKHHALAALAKFRRELTSFSDPNQLLRRVIEAVNHHLEARAHRVHLRPAVFADRLGDAFYQLIALVNCR
jgi:hypothetical protein